MRSPGVIYRRYRQLLRKTLNEQIIDAKKRSQENCKYCIILKIKKNENSAKVPICMYSADSCDEAEVCTNPQECVRYSNKYDDPKQYIKDKLSKEIKDPITVQKKYPELYAYQWVLDKQLTDSMNKPSLIQKFLIILIYFLENLVKIIGNNSKSIGPI